MIVGKYPTALFFSFLFIKSIKPVIQVALALEKEFTQSPFVIVIVGYDGQSGDFISVFISNIIRISIKEVYEYIFNVNFDVFFCKTLMDYFKQK